MNLLGVLSEKGLITSADRAAIDQEVKGKKHTLDEALREHGITMSEALRVAGESYGFPGRTLSDPPVPESVLSYIPEESARHYKIAPLSVEGGALEVGMVDPDNIEALDALQFISGKLGMPYKVFLISEPDFKRVLESYKNLSGEIGKALSEIETSVKQGEPETKAKSLAAALAEENTIQLYSPVGSADATLKEDAPITKIVSTTLRYAIEGKASDIHIEPSPERTRVRFRLDGELHTTLELPAKVHEAVVARIKILAQLRLDERRKPQDGRFSATIDKRRVDFRTSTFPTEYGEKMEMRILDQASQAPTLESLGLTGSYLTTVRDMLKAPYGIILIAGPTGSGKSTTLFAMLSEMDRETENVVSLEDPVEYWIPGVSQSQVRPEIGYTFASGLRSILRQDPDVIMVGEIRDKETAQLAIQAALTGHLVFSTIHTNTATGSIPRLIDMGVDPYLIAPTLIAVIGQRLVRKLSEGGGKAFPVNDSIKLLLDKEFADLPATIKNKLPAIKQFYHAVPTAESPTGMRGRIGVFEILSMNKELEQVVLKNPIEESVYAAARAQGMFTMREDAIMKALAGEIPFEEINTLGGELFPEDEY